MLVLKRCELVEEGLMIGLKSSTGIMAGSEISVLILENTVLFLEANVLFDQRCVQLEESIKLVLEGVVAFGSSGGLGLKGSVLFVGYSATEVGEGVFDHLRPGEKVALQWRQVFLPGTLA